MVPSDMVTPPVLLPASRIWNLDGACFVGSSASLNVTVSTPVAFWYAADDALGRVMSAVICSASELFVPKRLAPLAPTLTVYDVLLGRSFMLSVLLDMCSVKRELSASPAPLTSEYSGACSNRRAEFCVAMAPTVRLSRFSAVLSSVMYHGPRFWLKDEAPSNMETVKVTEETSHPEMSPLKEEAPLNMPAMLVTAETSHPDRSPSKAAALANMPAMLVTAETSHPDMSPSKAAAPLNMPSMSVTAETSHPDRSPSKAAAL